MSHSREPTLSQSAGDSRGSAGGFNPFDFMELISEEFLDVYIKADRAEGLFHLAHRRDNLAAWRSVLWRDGDTRQSMGPHQGVELLQVRHYQCSIDLAIALQPSRQLVEHFVL